MELMKFTFCLLLIMATTVMMVFSSTIRGGGGIVFEDSTENESRNVDIRPGHGHRNRNYRGRGKGHIEVREFEQGIPGVYPIKGPPQLPYVLSTTVPSVQQVTPASEVSRPNLIYQPARPTTPGIQYSNNPFLNNVQATTKSNVVSSGRAITNQLPTSDKPSATTPSYQNPRRTDLLYGSNLLEEEPNREGKASTSEDIDFGSRGLFDTEKHCPVGQVLVNNRCRATV